MIMIIVEAVNNALTSYIRLCNYVKLNSNEPMLNGAFVTEKWLNNFLVNARKTFVV